MLKLMLQRNGGSRRFPGLSRIGPGPARQSSPACFRKAFPALACFSVSPGQATTKHCSAWVSSPRQWRSTSSARRVQVLWRTCRPVPHERLQVLQGAQGLQRPQSCSSDGSHPEASLPSAQSARPLHTCEERETPRWPEAPSLGRAGGDGSQLGAHGLKKMGKRDRWCRQALWVWGANPPLEISFRGTDTHFPICFD